MTNHDSGREWDDQLESLERDGHVARQWVDDVISWLLQLRPAATISHIIDAGAGPGYAACAFARAIPDAHVTALDPTGPFLERAEQRASEMGVSDRVNVCLGDIETTVATLAPADIVWASHVVHHLPDPVGALRTLGAQLSDNGILTIAEGGLPLRVLPGGYGVGRPSLASRLDAAISDHWLADWDLTEQAVGGSRNWPLLMADAGLSPGPSRTFVIEHPAPVHDRVRHYAIAHYEGVRELAGHMLDVLDAAALDVLLDPYDDRSLHRRPDLFILTAKTLHTATRAGRTN